MPPTKFTASVVIGATPCCEHADSEAATAGPQPSLCVLTMGLLWQTHAPSCVHSQSQPGSHSRPFGMSPHSQTVSSPWVCPLKPEFQHPVTAHTSRHASWAQKCGNMARTICVGVSLPCRAASQLPHSPLQPLKLPICPGGPPSQ